MPPFSCSARAGSGGSADVFRADRNGGGGALPVALKVARSAEGAAALAREVGHASLALSPCLPELLDAGWLCLDPHCGADGVGHGACGARAFLALRWIEGAPLDPRAPGGEDRVALALRVAGGVGEALADLHEVGTAHGDVKPDNLLLGNDGGVHLLDLGLAGPAYARAIEGATLRYLARGDADLGDARARDLLALGVVLAEIADPAVAAAADPIAAARAARLPTPIAALCAALLAPSPGATPVGGDGSRTWRGRETRGARGRAERDARRVRASYLRVRREARSRGSARPRETWPRGSRRR